MEKDDDINRNNSRNNPDYDPNRNNNHNNPNATTLTTAQAQVPELPLEMWCDILEHLGVDAKDVALVSRQLHAAWQMGLLEMHLSPFDLDHLAWMSSRSFHDYPALRTLTLGAREAEAEAEAQATRQRQLISLPVNNASPSPSPSVTLSLYLNQTTHTRSVCELARKQPELASRVRHLTLYRPTKYWWHEEKEPEQTVIDVIKTFPCLHELTLMTANDFWSSNNKDVQQASPDHAPGAGQSIKRLNLINIDEIGSENSLAMANHFPNVTELVLEACSFINVSLGSTLGAGIGSWPKLRSLRIRTTRRGRGINDSDLQAIALGCPELQHLVLDGPHLITPVGLQALGTNGAPSRLTHLTLANSRYITDEHLAALSHVPDLQALDLENLEGLTNEALMALAECRNLTSFNVVDCPGITEEGLERLFSFCQHLFTFNGFDLNSDETLLYRALATLRPTRNARQNGNEDDQPST